MSGDISVTNSVYCVTLQCTMAKPLSFSRLDLSANQTEKSACFSLPASRTQSHTSLKYL